MISGFGGRIRKVRPLDENGKYRLEITGNYRYCENVKRHHKANQIYFLVNPLEKTYYQKCYDPECHHFQSAKRKIFTEKIEYNPLS